MRYKIVYGDFRDIEEKVEELIRDGWVPQGGINTVVTNNVHTVRKLSEYTFMQAMILKL